MAAYMGQACMYVETAMRGYHVYLSKHKLKLGEILTTDLECDPEAIAKDKYAIKLMCEENEQIVGHIPKYLSKLCFKFLQGGGDLDAEVIGKRFNAGQGMGVEVPIELKFSGCKQYVERLRDKLVCALQKEGVETSRKPEIIMHGTQEK
eukprot:gene2255-2579_t